MWNAEIGLFAGRVKADCSKYDWKHYYISASQNSISGDLAVMSAADSDD